MKTATLTLAALCMLAGTAHASLLGDYLANQRRAEEGLDKLIGKKGAAARECKRRCADDGKKTRTSARKRRKACGTACPTKVEKGCKAARRKVVEEVGRCARKMDQPRCRERMKKAAEGLRRAFR